MVNDRYDKDYMHGDVTFYLSNYIPDDDQCRFLILKVLEQAMRDYVSLAENELPAEITAWKLARDFIYDDTYMIMWGDLELQTEDLLGMVDLDIEWVRDQTTKKFNERYNECPTKSNLPKKKLRKKSELKHSK